MDRRRLKKNGRFTRNTSLRNRRMSISFKPDIRLESECNNNTAICVVGCGHISPDILLSAMTPEGWEVLTLPEKSWRSDPSNTHGDNLRLKSWYEREVLGVWDIEKLRKTTPSIMDIILAEWLIAENNRLSANNANNIFCKDIKKLFKKY